jgi:tungstate transport system ATP-binding protein
MTAPILELAEVTVRAGGRLILDVSRFTVAPGETIALVGPNGAGKTTLLHVAALLRQPDAGVVSILGQQATTRNAASLRRSLAVVFQAPLLFDISVLANATAGLRFQGVPRKEADHRARAWLERFGVDHLVPRPARGLSGGEAGRVALARAFATEPAILLLDEPFSALDAPTRAALLPSLRDQLRATGAAAVLVTHDLEEALAFGDRIDLMDQGRIIASGDAQSLIGRPPSIQAATLLGIETILPASVIRRDGDSLQLSILPVGPSLPAFAPDAETMHPGQRVTLVLPAGAARVICPDDPPPQGWHALPARIVTATPLLTGTRLVVETPAHIAAVAPWETSRTRWQTGDRVIVTFSPRAIHLIPEEA